MCVQAKSPSECSSEELDEFICLVQQGGEVQGEGLSELVKDAKALAFLRIDGECVGVAGLKSPRTNYRSSVFCKANSSHKSEEFPYELGWVHILENHRGKKFSRLLVEQVLKRAENRNVYATSKTTEGPMHRTLIRFLFAKDGDAWQSDRRKNEKLFLFVRIAHDASSAVRISES